MRMGFLTNPRQLHIKNGNHLLGDRLTAGLQTLDLPIQVRILVPQPAAHSPVAQLVERVAVNHLVGGSSPSRGARKIKTP